MKVGREVEGHTDGGLHLGRNLALGQLGRRLHRHRLDLLHFVLLGILLLEIGSHATKDGREDEEGDDDDEETSDGDNPAFGVDPIFVSQQ